MVIECLGFGNCLTGFNTSNGECLTHGLRAALDVKMSLDVVTLDTEWEPVT